MKNLLVALSLFSSAPAFASSFCNVYVESTPHMYDLRVIQVDGPLVGKDRSVLVAANGKSAVEISEKELNQRIASGDFKDWDGATVVGFQQSEKGRYAINVIEIDQQKKYEDMRYTLTVGAITKKVSLGTLNGTKRFLANCAAHKSWNGLK